MKKIFKEEESIEIWKILGQLRIYNCLKNIVEENISQEFRLENIDETKNYLIDEFNRNEPMSKERIRVLEL